MEAVNTEGSPPAETHINLTASVECSGNGNLELSLQWSGNRTVESSPERSDRYVDCLTASGTGDEGVEDVRTPSTVEEHEGDEYERGNRDPRIWSPARPVARGSDNRKRNVKVKVSGRGKN